MRLALFVHCFFPAHFYGTEAYTLALAKNLIALGHDVTVVSGVFYGEPRQNSTVERYEYDGVRVISLDKNDLPNTRVKDTFYQPQMRGLLEGVLDEIRPDVVHVTHLVNHTAVLLEVLEDRSLPACATFTDFFGFCYNNRLELYDGTLCAGPNRHALNCLACHLTAEAGQQKRPWTDVRAHPTWMPVVTRAMYAAQKLPPWRTGRLAGLVQDLAQRPLILRSLYRTYARAIAPTKFLMNAYEANNIGVPMTRIPFGVDVARHAKPPRGAAHKLVVGFIGQLMRHKGPDLLLDAARRYLVASDYEIRLYGSDTQDPAFSAMLREQAEGLPVRFLGVFPGERMRAVMDELDVLVIPSRWYENSPLVLLNALASHTPVVVSDVLGMTEFVEEGVSGHAFRRGDADDLGRVLRGLARERERLQAMTAQTSYEITSREMTERTARVYTDLVG